MSRVRHGSATTTHAVRAAIQRPQASLATLSRELGINPKTVAKWRKRATVEDLKTGPEAPHSTTLTEAEEAMVVAFGTVRNSVREAIRWNGEDHRYGNRQGHVGPAACGS
jgi:hypothetical protein